ncbi:MAG TPA: L-serine ammonia-lyase, partial [Chroococcales cyanobacterium]
MNPIRADQIGPLDMFKIGIGPSSSHTVGPMVAALEFRSMAIAALKNQEVNGSAGKGELRIVAELFGSLSATGRGHATDGAVCAGLAGMHPKSASPERIWAAMPDLKVAKELDLDGTKIKFDPDSDIIWSDWLMDRGPLPHPNTIRFRLMNRDQIVVEQVIMSVGGGFVETVDPETGRRREPETGSLKLDLPYPFDSAGEFVEQCNKHNIKAWELVIANEEAKGMTEKVLRERLSEILSVFDQCIENGLAAEGILPGGLHVRRRAKALFEQLKAGKSPVWAEGDLRPSVYAMAVNEENAAGGRVVTAPTNGSSGLIPAVWRTLRERNDLSTETLQNGLMVASVVGALVKTHASISGAEVGCQGEVGTSCAMAAAGAVAMLGGSPGQMEQAAEIGIEHHLGMTCDPIMGLVQVPCIERNAMGAVKALNAACLSLASDGTHLISLDRALEVMKQTG